jgi:hypothetical protein
VTKPPPVYKPQPPPLRMAQVSAYCERSYGMKKVTRETVYQWTKVGIRGRVLPSTLLDRPGCRTPVRVVAVSDLFGWVVGLGLAKHYLVAEGSN